MKNVFLVNEKGLVEGNERVFNEGKVTGKEFSLSNYNPENDSVNIYRDLLQSFDKESDFEVHSNTQVTNFNLFTYSAEEFNNYLEHGLHSINELDSNFIIKVDGVVEVPFFTVFSS
jgi:hypothetical protein